MYECSRDCWTKDREFKSVPTCTCSIHNRHRQQIMRAPQWLAFSLFIYLYYMAHISFHQECNYTAYSSSHHILCNRIHVSSALISTCMATWWCPWSQTNNLCFTDFSSSGSRQSSRSVYWNTFCNLWPVTFESTLWSFIILLLLHPIFGTIRGITAVTSQPTRHYHREWREVARHYLRLYKLPCAIYTAPPMQFFQYTVICFFSLWE